MKGDIQESLPTSTDETARGSQQDAEMRVYYMVHPSLDVEGSSSFS